MRLYNSRTQTIEPCALDHSPITVYVCGITPYDTTHLGHAFTYVMVDVLIRYLEYQQHTLRYVQNVTDIDDDLLRRAARDGEDWRALGNRWTSHFIQDMQRLNVRPPEHLPRATSVIPQIVDQVTALVRVGLAYVADGSVYYSVDAWREFGKLSHLPKDAMLEVANARGNVPDAQGKRNPLDFVLWQAQAPGEPAWESPWGSGRPGWHIECSTLVGFYLGNTIDFHGGGSDLIFPHHECEIAQMEPVTGRQPYVRYWFHTAMVEHEGEKMSKSLGNLVMARDLLQHYSSDALRLYLADHHYRATWSYDAAALDKAAVRARAITAAATAPSMAAGPFLIADDYRDRFNSAMENDLDTVRALRVLSELADAITHSGSRGHDLSAAQLRLREMATVFGLTLGDSQPDSRVQPGWQRHLQDFS